LKSDVISEILIAF